MSYEEMIAAVEEYFVNLPETHFIHGIHLKRMPSVICVSSNYIRKKFNKIKKRETS